MMKFVKAVTVVAMVAAGVKAIIALVKGSMFEVVAYAMLLGMFWGLYRKIMKEIGDKN